jgi:hypothetical protein
MFSDNSVPTTRMLGAGTSAKMGGCLALSSALLDGGCAGRVSSGKAAGHSDGFVCGRLDSGSLCSSRVGNSSSARIRPKIFSIADRNRPYTNQIVNSRPVPLRLARKFENCLLGLTIYRVLLTIEVADSDRNIFRGFAQKPNTLPNPCSLGKARVKMSRLD